MRARLQELRGVPRGDRLARERRRERLEEASRELQVALALQSYCMNERRAERQAVFKCEEAQNRART